MLHVVEEKSIDDLSSSDLRTVVALTKWSHHNTINDSLGLALSSIYDIK